MALTTRSRSRRRRPDAVVRAGKAELRALRDLTHQLDSSSLNQVTLLVEGRATTMPPAAVDGLRRVVANLAQEAAVAILPYGVELTTQAAADLLGISRPRLIQILDDSQIPYRREGTHRRLRLDDVLAYRQVRSERVEAALREMQRFTEEFPGS